MIQKKYMVLGLGLILLTGGGCLSKSEKLDDRQNIPQPVPAQEQNDEPEAKSEAPSTAVNNTVTIVDDSSDKEEETAPSVANPTPVDVPAVKSFKVSGQNFSFSLSEIKVKKGDKVKIEFTNAGGSHDFVIDEFKVRTAQLASGASETIEFTADKSGIFEYYCSVGSHRAMGMKGSLVVE